MNYIDFHAHAFPNALAATTIPALEKKGEVTAALDGTLDSLLASMDRSSIKQSVICSIATKPQQFQAILAWSHAIKSDRIIPFPSFHPESATVLDEIQTIHQEGFKGVKLHPYYQEFYLDEKRLWKIFDLLSDLGLIVVMHTGFDIGFPRELRADPEKIVSLVKQFPDLKFIATHLGAWEQWDEVHEKLIGKNIYLDIAFSLQFLPPEKARKLILDHNDEMVLYGSDSPWADQQTTIDQLRALDLGSVWEEKILGENGEKLLWGK